MDFVPVANSSVPPPFAYPSLRCRRTHKIDPFRPQRLAQHLNSRVSAFIIVERIYSYMWSVSKGRTRCWTLCCSLLCGKLVCVDSTVRPPSSTVAIHGHNTTVVQSIVLDQPVYPSSTVSGACITHTIPSLATMGTSYTVLDFPSLSATNSSVSRHLRPLVITEVVVKASDSCLIGHLGLVT